MTLRSVLFWPHLVAGVLAGIIILTMSLTGVALTYERQMLAWVDHHEVAPPAPGTPRLSVESLLARLHAAHPDEPIASITMRADPTATAVVSVGGRNVQVDPYTAAVLPAGSTAMRSFMSNTRALHRWLAMTGEHRATAKAITGWSNLLFAFIVLSGIYLWLPRVWSWPHVRSVLWFRGGLRGKARDFNWHNAIGIWSAVPLFLVVITAFPISFPWAGSLIYRMVGETPPAQGGRRRAAAPRADAAPQQLDALAAGLDPLWERAAARVDGWQSITLRLPDTPDAPLAFAIDAGNGGQPQLKSTLTLSRAGDVVAWDTFDSQSLGRRLRSWSRFTHTGEAFGMVGQTVAGLVSAGGCVLVWTGIALAWRRLLAWRKRVVARRTAPDTGPLEGATS